MKQLYPETPRLKTSDHGLILKITLFFAVLVLVFRTDTFAQDPPAAINYQAILRDAETSQVLSNQNVYLSAEFLDGPLGEVVYAEEFTSVQTDIHGLINLRLGRGSAISGNFSSIPWRNGNVWLRLSVDAGSGLAILQESPFSTVPYAFYAGESGSTADGDSDPENELIQTIDLNGALMTVTEGGQQITIDLSSLIADADADPLNEILDSLNLNEETGVLSLYEGDAIHTVDLSELAGTSANPFDELQDLELNDHILTITQNESATPIDMSSYLDNTDEQDLSLTGTTLSLTNDDTPVDLAALPGLGDDADADPQNEIQDLALTGNELSVTNNPFATAIDLSPYLDNTDGQDLSLTGTTLNLTGDATPVDLSSLPGLGDDADANPANELQDLQLSGDFLSLTGLTLATQIDLSPYDNSELPEGQIFIGNAADQAEPRDVTGDIDLQTNGEVRVTGLQSISVSNATPQDGEVLVYDEANDEWIPQSIVPSATEETKYYSVDPMDFVELVDVSSGNDLEDGNALKFYDARAPFAMIFNSGSVRTIGAPLHLPHGAEIENIRIFFKDDGPGVMQFRLARKNVTDYSTGNEALLLAVTAASFGNDFIDIPVNNSNIIDNSEYIYRLLVRFSEPTDDDEPDIDDVEQRVYGAVVQYKMN